MKQLSVLLPAVLALAIPAYATAPGAGQSKASRELLVGRWTPTAGGCAKSWIDLGADGKFKTPADYEGDWSLKDGYLVALDMVMQQYVLAGQTVMIDRNTIEVDGKTRLFRCT